MRAVIMAGGLGTRLGPAAADIPKPMLPIMGKPMLDVDWNRFMEFHRRHNALITLYGHPNGHPYDSDALVVDGDGRVIRIEAKNTDRGLECRNFVNAGIYCASPGLLDAIRRPEKMYLEKGVIA